MTNKEKPTQERLKELFHYCLDTGVFTRLVTVNKRAKAGDVAGAVMQKGYLFIGVDMGRYLAHRLAWVYVHGYWPEHEIDHINHQPGDNRICNLREVSHHCNSKNQKMKRSNKSGISGVSQDRRRGVWRVYINHNGKQVWGGYFHCIEKATEKRKEIEVKYGFHPNHGSPT